MLVFPRASFSQNTATEPQTLTLLPWQMVARYPHQPAAFTQGLELYHGKLLESSGRYGQSKLLSQTFPNQGSNSALRGLALPKHWFAEGLTVYRGKIYLLSWRAQRGLIIDPEHFGVLGQFQYKGQGWGLCYHPQQGDGGSFVMSNGSHRLQLRSTQDFALIKELRREEGRVGEEGCGRGR